MTLFDSHRKWFGIEPKNEGFIHIDRNTKLLTILCDEIMYVHKLLCDINFMNS